MVLKFNSIEELLVKEDVEDQTPGNKRLASSVLSIQVVADGKPQSVPLSFKLGHLEVSKQCSVLLKKSNLLVMLLLLLLQMNCIWRQ